MGSEPGETVGRRIGVDHESLDLGPLQNPLRHRAHVGHAVIGLAAIDGRDDEAAAGRRLDLDGEARLLVEALLQADEERRVAAIEDVVGQKGDRFDGCRALRRGHQ